MDEKNLDIQEIEGTVEEFVEAPKKRGRKPKAEVEEPSKKSESADIVDDNKDVVADSTIPVTLVESNKEELKAVKLEKSSTSVNSNIVQSNKGIKFYKGPSEKGLIGKIYRNIYLDGTKIGDFQTAHTVIPEVGIVSGYVKI